MYHIRRTQIIATESKSRTIRWVERARRIVERRVASALGGAALGLSQSMGCGVPAVG